MRSNLRIDISHMDQTKFDLTRTALLCERALQVHDNEMVDNPLKPIQK